MLVFSYASSMLKQPSQEADISLKKNAAVLSWLGLWDSQVCCGYNTNCFSFKSKAILCLLILSQEIFQRRKPGQSLSTFFSSFDGCAFKQKPH